MTEGARLLKSLARARRDVAHRKRLELEEVEREVAQAEEMFNELFSGNDRMISLIDEKFMKIKKKIYEKLRYLGP